VEVKEFTELEMEDGSVVTAVGRLVKRERMKMNEC